MNAIMQFAIREFRRNCVKENFLGILGEFLRKNISFHEISNRLFYQKFFEMF